MPLCRTPLATENGLKTQHANEYALSDCYNSKQVNTWLNLCIFVISVIH